MGRCSVFLTVIVVAAFGWTGCSGGGSPVSPTVIQELKPGSNSSGQNHTQLWGYYDVFVDVENQTVEAVPNRQMMFAQNTVWFVNKTPENITFQVNNVVKGAGCFDVDIDVTLKHPFPGMPQYNGYDVRGVFIGHACSTLDYNDSLDYPVMGGTQYMLDDPVNGDGGGPDGYTRWFNPVEFTTPCLFGFTPGVYQSHYFGADGTLCPYRYFADGLGANQDLWEFLTTTGGDGVFSADGVNTRNYYLRFNVTKFQYGYAIIANWEAPDVHPSNALEAVACSVSDNSDIHFPESAGSFGDLNLDFSLFGWEHQPSTIYIESTVLLNVASFDPAVIMTGGDEHYSTYHVEIPADSVNDIKGHEFWVIAEYEGNDYSNFGIPNETGSDSLAAFFRYDLAVDYSAEFGWVRTWGGSYEEDSRGIAVDGSGNVYVTGYFSDTVDFDPIGGDPHTSNGWGDNFLIKFDSNGNFVWARTWGGEYTDEDWGVAVDGFGNVYVMGDFWGVVDFNPDGGDPHTSNVYSRDVCLSKFDSSGNFEWAQTWGGEDEDKGRGVAADSSGNVYVAGHFEDLIDFDPVGGDQHTSNGYSDVFLSKFDSTGTFEWARTWGGSDNDYSQEVTADGSGNVYITGNFTFLVDFDPDGGDPHTSNGYSDVFLSKFDSTGNFEWARTWGGWNYDYGLGVAADGSGNAYITGGYRYTVDFNPDDGDPHTSNGGHDVFLSKFDSTGNFKWARTWGGGSGDVGSGVAADSFGNVYVTGYFKGTVDFDPGGGDPHTSNGYCNDAFLSKFDSIGNLKWAQTWGGIWSYSSVYGNGVAADGIGNVFVTGDFYGTTNFAPTDPPCNANPDFHTPIGSHDVFLTKHLPDGCW